ncbi:mCG1030612, partial [Mus musculus]
KETSGTGAQDRKLTKNKMLKRTGSKEGPLTTKGHSCSCSRGKTANTLTTAYTH